MTDLALIDAFRRRSLELERINSELRQFTHLAANELQEPLRAVKGYAQILEERLPPDAGPELTGYVQRVRRSGERLSSVLQDLLDYTKLNTLSLQEERLNMAAVFVQVKSELDQQVRLRRAQLTRSHLPWVMGDAAGLTVVLRSLISNALKFHRGQPQIEVGHRIREHRHQIWVKDDGIGIAERFHREVFEPFRRLHTQEEFPGVGLGLAAARSVIERHAGDIWLQSEPGVGTTVFFELPGVS